ncbi:amidohydrolase family protein [Paremcibacter congregatus]|uniref:amidohydrolase family protein n=1 Tax=Paremcibacter congregatus TaxID=2043170 RepID=UPI0030EB39B2
MQYFGLRPLLLGVLMTAVSSLAIAAPMTALVGGNLVDVEDGKVIKNSVILIEGERIAQIGTARDLEIPQDATVIDVTNKWLTPGLVNMHVHFTLKLPGAEAAQLQYETAGDMTLRGAVNARKSVLSGTTTVRTPGEDNHVALALDKAIKKGDFIGPRIFSAGTAITPTGGHSGEPVLNGVDGPVEVTKAVRREILAGASWIKLMITRGLADPHGAINSSDMTFEEMRAAVDIAHRHGVKVTAHSSSAVATEEALRAGVDSFEHGYFFDREIFTKMKKANAWYIPTIVVSQKGALEFFKKIGSPDWYLKRAESVGKDHWKALQTAIKMNVNIAMGSDQFPFEPNEGTVASIRETELYVEAGMTPLNALRAATLQPARLLEADKDVGSLKVGKYADILVLDQNPITNIRALRTLGMVIKGGQTVRNDWAKSPVQ